MNMECCLPHFSLSLKYNPVTLWGGSLGIALSFSTEMAASFLTQLNYIYEMTLNSSGCSHVSPWLQ